ncbi:hypothetical protein [Gordonia sp. NPDC058843]|uniref:AraC-like ligand-binding domain-containing protein n=1 Tax=Gordonia sp. NPDC058843 TaxID=3346648 RepID=UPI00368A5309
MVAVMEAWRFGRVNLFCASMTGNQLTRSRRNIRSGPAGNVAVAWQEFGVARFEQHGRRREVRPGNLMLVDLDRPYGFSWPGWGRSRCLNVPLDALSADHDGLRRAADRLGHSPCIRLSAGTSGACASDVDWICRSSLSSGSPPAVARSRDTSGGTAPIGWRNSLPDHVCDDRPCPRRACAMARYPFRRSSWATPSEACSRSCCSTAGSVPRRS